MSSTANGHSGLDREVMFEAVMTGLRAGLAFLDGDLRFVQVNDVMAAMNGLPAREHVGRTPMELLPGLDPANYLPQLRRALAGEDVTGVEIEGSTAGRRGGTWLESFHPVRRHGEVVGAMVAAVDVTEERAARREAARSACQLAQLRAISEAGLTERSLDGVLDDIVHRARALVGGETATLLLDEEHTGTLRVRAAAGLDEKVRNTVAVPVGAGLAGGIAASGEARIIDDLLAVEAVSPYLREYGLRSLVATPLRARGRTIGVLHVASRRPGAFDAPDLSLLAAAADRAALVIDRASAFEHQRTVAEALQRSLLPGRLPELPQVQLAARYRPSGPGLAVGGDWYDALQVPDGRLAVVIGDVVGHGVESAALMGQLRTALRAHLADGHTASSALHRLDELTCAAGPEVIATAAVGLLDPDDGSLQLAVAGHAPPLLRDATGRVTVLDQHSGSLLGTGGSWPTQTIRLAPGSSLLLYTDGLVEHRAQDLDTGIERAAQALAQFADPERCVDELLATAAPTKDPGYVDDIALLLLNRPSEQPDRLALSTADESADLRWIRRQVHDWVEQTGADADVADDIVLAVTEAIVEAAGHPTRGAGRPLLHPSRRRDPHQDPQRP